MNPQALVMIIPSFQETKLALKICRKELPITLGLVTSLNTITDDFLLIVLGRAPVLCDKVDEGLENFLLKKIWLHRYYSRLAEWFLSQYVYQEGSCECVWLLN